MKLLCVGAAVLALVLSQAACGSDDSSSGPVVSVSSASANGPYPPVPTAAQLDAQFKAATDPNQPDSVRIGLVQDGEKFLSAMPDLFRAIRENPKAHYGIVDPVFDNHDGTLTATMRLDKDGTGQLVQSEPVHFLALNGTWKLSRTDLCGMLISSDYHTPACG